MTSSVKFNHRDSPTFPVSQGTRQGGLSSPKDYKIYQIDLLETLTSLNSGFHIGPTDVVSPTCADDMILISSSMSELQFLLSITQSYANKERNIIHPEKTTIIPYNVAPEELQHLQASNPWKLGETPVTI